MYLETTYQRARQRFLAAADAAGAQLCSRKIPCRISVSDDLFIDSAYIHTGDSADLLIVTTGVHGVEGYAGSACITYLLESGLARELQSAVLLIHAANPWGFANDSRNTEDNVDLNRNFVDFTAPLPVSASYSRLHPLLFENY